MFNEYILYSDSTGDVDVTITNILEGRVIEEPPTTDLGNSEGQTVNSSKCVSNSIMWTQCNSIGERTYNKGIKVVSPLTEFLTLVKTNKENLK